MSKERVIALSVIHGNLTKAEAARHFGVSWRWVHTLVTRYEQEGHQALEPRSRRPKTNPRATSAQLRDRIVELRVELVKSGLDAGPVSIASRLELEGKRPPSTSTIRRILHAENLVIPEPKKRPKSSLRRFEADQPNETWQSDFTHWRLTNNVDIEILNWLDDHSRYLLGCTAHQPVTGPIVVTQFTRVINEYGPPASTLPITDWSTPPASAAGKTSSNTCSPRWESPRKTDPPATPKPKEKLNDSTRPSKNGSPPNPAPKRWKYSKNSSITFGPFTTINAPTALWPVPLRLLLTPPRSKPHPAVILPTPTPGSASILSPKSDNSPTAAPANSTNSESVEYTPANPRSSSTTKPP